MTLSLEPNLCLLNKKIKETIKMFPWYKRLIEDDKIEDSNIILKYCVWHCHNITLIRTILDANSRASIWYCSNIEIINCKLNNVKVCRNCFPGRTTLMVASREKPYSA